MNENEACRILGVTRSASANLAERAYRQQSRDLQRRIAPGNPLPVRQKAQQDLARLTSAWNTLKIAKTSRQQRKPLAKQATLIGRPHGLAGNWEEFFSQLPFSGFTISLVAILLFVAGAFFVHQYMKGF